MYIYKCIYIYVYTYIYIYICNRHHISKSRYGLQAYQTSIASKQASKQANAALPPGPSAGEPTSPSLGLLLVPTTPGGHPRGIGGQYNYPYRALFDTLFNKYALPYIK